MIFSKEIEKFIDEYSREIEAESAAVFAGAGLSVGAGYVDWKRLLQPIVEELELDVDRETDLVTLAQYHVNEARQRGKLNKLLVDEFSKQWTLTENHNLLARLPIPIFWTTNYDKLIETALEREGKRPDVKHRIDQLQITKSGRDAVVYKMHGDVEHPAETVLTKDDYERYPHNKQLFLTALSGDLVSKTFLFLGLSFSDPNLDYILSRVRVWLDKNVRPHYAILRRVQKDDFGDDAVAEYHYQLRRQSLFINDLKRFGIESLLINSYSDITLILRRLYDVHRGRSVMLSGSAREYGRWDKESAEALVSRISGKLIEDGYRIVSGFGLGIGSAAISGALEKIYASPDAAVGDRLILRPFPQSVPRGQKKAEVHTRYRTELVSMAGTAIFMFGNRMNRTKTINSPGVIEEFDLAVANGLSVIPIGATGYAAKQLWERVDDDFERYFPNPAGLKRPFARLGKEDADAETIVAALMEMLQRLK